MASHVYMPLWDSFRMSKTICSVEAVAGPTDISPSFMTLSPSEVSHLKNGVAWIPCFSDASHVTSYVSPATALPIVIIDNTTAFDGTVSNEEIR